MNDTKTCYSSSASHSGMIMARLIAAQTGAAECSLQTLYRVIFSYSETSQNIEQVRIVCVCVSFYRTPSLHLDVALYRNLHRASDARASLGVFAVGVLAHCLICEFRRRVFGPYAVYVNKIRTLGYDGGGQGGGVAASGKATGGGGGGAVKLWFTFDVSPHVGCECKWSRRESWCLPKLICASAALPVIDTFTYARLDDSDTRSLERQFRYISGMFPTQRNASRSTRLILFSCAQSWYQLTPVCICRTRLFRMIQSHIYSANATC